MIRDLFLADLAVELFMRPKRLGRITIEEPYGRPLSVDGIHQHSSLWAFSLPRVCRQFYDEISVVLYARTPFYVEFYPLDASQNTLDRWADKLLPYQRHAITAVEPFFYLYNRYYLQIPTLPLRRTFPGLQRVIVPETIVKCEQIYLLTLRRDINLVVAHLPSRIRARDGSNLTVQFIAYPDPATFVPTPSINVRNLNGERIRMFMSLGELGFMYISLG